MFQGCGWARKWPRPHAGARRKAAKNRRSPKRLRRKEKPFGRCKPLPGVFQHASSPAFSLSSPGFPNALKNFGVWGGAPGIPLRHFRFCPSFHRHFPSCFFMSSLTLPVLALRHVIGITTYQKMLREFHCEEIFFREKMGWAAGSG